MNYKSCICCLLLFFLPSLAFADENSPKIEPALALTLKKAGIPLEETKPHKNITLVDKFQSQQNIPESNNSVMIQGYRFVVNSPKQVADLFKKIHLVEHKNTGTYLGQVMGLRSLAYVILQGSTLTIWAITPLSWDLKAAAMVVSVMEHLIFTYYENIIDEKVYHSRVSQKAIRIPLDLFLTVYEKLQDIEKDPANPFRQKIKPFSMHSGKLLAIASVNWFFLYYYNSLLNSQGLLPEHGVLKESLLDLGVFMGTGMLLTGIRANLKKHGRSFLTPYQIQKAAFVLNLASGISFITLATNVFPTEAIIVSFGIPSLVALQITSQEESMALLFNKRGTNASLCKGLFLR